METLHKIIGIGHFLFDQLPSNTATVEPKPRKLNAYQRDGQPLVARIEAADDLRGSVEKLIGSLGGLQPLIKSGDRVLVKPNFNSADPFPASTNLEFLEIVLQMLLEAGAKVTIGESAGGVSRPTRNVLRKLGVYELASKLGVELIVFEDRLQDWVEVNIRGEYLKSVILPRSAYEADKLVYLPCLKTHSLARYTGALKLAFGFVHPGQRRSFHISHLRQKLAEVNLCWQPDLVIMDGRKAFVSGGPESGQLAEPGILLASGDQVALDIEAVNTLRHFGARLPEPRELAQIAEALKHGLGKDDYMAVGPRVARAPDRTGPSPANEDEPQAVDCDFDVSS